MIGGRPHGDTWEEWREEGGLLPVVGNDGVDRLALSLKGGGNLAKNVQRCPLDCVRLAKHRHAGLAERRSAYTPAFVPQPHIFFAGSDQRLLLWVHLLKQVETLTVGRIARSMT